MTWDRVEIKSLLGHTEVPRGHVWVRGQLEGWLKIRDASMNQWHLCGPEVPECSVGPRPDLAKSESAFSQDPQVKARCTAPRSSGLELQKMPRCTRWPGFSPGGDSIPWGHFLLSREWVLLASSWPRPGTPCDILGCTEWPRYKAGSGPECQQRRG